MELINPSLELRESDIPNLIHIIYEYWSLRHLNMKQVILYKIFRQYAAKRQKQRPEWRKTKYALLKYIQTNILMK